jgi:hypothetical protein
MKIFKMGNNQIGKDSVSQEIKKIDPDGRMTEPVWGNKGNTKSPLYNKGFVIGHKDPATNEGYRLDYDEKIGLHLNEQKKSAPGSGRKFDNLHHPIP